MIGAKRGGGGDEGEKRDGKKERDRLPSLPNPPLPFPFSILYHFFIAYAGYKQVFPLARLYMLPPRSNV